MEATTIRQLKILTLEYIKKTLAAEISIRVTQNATWDKIKRTVDNMNSVKVTINRECMICNKETERSSKEPTIFREERTKKIMVTERFAKQKGSRTMEIINLEVNLETRAITIE